jgi:hypothetical protein
MSTKDLHNIIEAKFWNNNCMHQQSHSSQNTTTPPLLAILAALSHPGNYHNPTRYYSGNLSFTKHHDIFHSLLAINEPFTIVSNTNVGIPTLDYKSFQNIMNAIVSSIQHVLF